MEISTLDNTNNQPLDLYIRRRAAYKALSEVLDEQALLQAMKMIEERDHNADKLTFLGIVEAAVETLGTNSQIISDLNIKLNKNLDIACQLLSNPPYSDMLQQQDPTKNNSLNLSATSSSIFRTNDILGSVENNLNTETLKQIGLVIANEALQHKCNSIIIARDDRDSSTKIADALIKGILSTGINVIDLGKVPLPILNFVTHYFYGKTGVLISGGHHSNDLNGLKVLLAGEILDEESIKRIKSKIENSSDKILCGPKGNLNLNTTYANEYIGMICEENPLHNPLSIVLEANNKTVNKFAIKLFESLGCKIIKVDKKNLKTSKNRALVFNQQQADIGFTFDNEGCRLKVFDNQGNYIQAEQLIMIFSIDILKSCPTCQIIHDTYETSNLATLITQNSGRPLLWKNGSAFMINQLKKTGAKFAGDIHGHLYFYDTWFGFDDALYAATRLLGLLSRESRPCSEIFSDLPHNSYTQNLSLNLASGENQKIVAQLINNSEFVNGKITNIDGLRVDFKNGWLLIRADPSSAALLFHFEADSNETLTSMKQNIKQILAKISPNVKIPV